MKLKLGSLFAGIGGFELAATWAGIDPIWSNEIDPFCCKVLRKNFDHEIIEKDIRQIGKESLRAVDIISGGDPCQPHSIAGMGKGKEDDRYLWPEMFRIIRELHPPWVVNENVGGSTSNGVLDIKIDDLESEGYTCQPYNIPAEAVGAMHQRGRIWLVAFNPNCKYNLRKSRNVQKEEQKISKRNNLSIIGEPVDLWNCTSNANTERCEKQHFPAKPDIRPEGLSRYFGFGSYAYGNVKQEAIKSGVMGMLDGLPQGMDYADRNKRISALGNAIVPQVAFQLFSAIVKKHNSHE